MACALPSLYEHLFPLTTVMKQRVVEHFDGNTLCTDRWTEVNNTGCGTFAMVNAVDEGFSITAASGATACSAITFNNINQYNGSGVVLIAVVRRVTNTACAQLIEPGLFECDAFGSTQDFAIVRNRNQTTNYQLITGDGCGTDTACTCVVTDLTFRINKMEGKACSFCLTLCGGCVDATNTVDIPNNKVEPAFRTNANSVEGRIRYLEAYNT